MTTRQEDFATGPHAHPLFKVIELLSRIPPRPDSECWISDYAFRLQDGRTFEGSARKKPQQYVKAHDAAMDKGLTYGKVRLADRHTERLGYLSVEHEQEKGRIRVNFKEYDIDHSNTFVSQALRAIRDIGFTLPVTTRAARPTEILALIADIRGFTTFCSSSEVESSYAAKFIQVFQREGDEFLLGTMHSITKWLGDGLLAVWEASEVNLPEVARILIDGSLEFQKRLLELGGKEPFNIPVPTQLGFGLARGSAFSTDAHGLDFIGQPINLAARLCDKARPSGLCMDSFVLRDFHPSEREWKQELVDIKSFGNRKIWIRA